MKRVGVAAIALSFSAFLYWNERRAAAVAPVVVALIVLALPSNRERPKLQSRRRSHSAPTVMESEKKSLPSTVVVEKQAVPVISERVAIIPQRRAVAPAPVVLVEIEERKVIPIIPVTWWERVWMSGPALIALTWVTEPIMLSGRQSRPAIKDRIFWSGVGKEWRNHCLPGWPVLFGNYRPVKLVCGNIPTTLCFDRSSNWVVAGYNIRAVWRRERHLGHLLLTNHLLEPFPYFRKGSIDEMIFYPSCLWSTEEKAWVSVQLGRVEKIVDLLRPGGTIQLCSEFCHDYFEQDDRLVREHSEESEWRCLRRSDEG
jgi:hypothetical protein